MKTIDDIKFLYEVVFIQDSTDRFRAVQASVAFF